MKTERTEKKVMTDHSVTTGKISLLGTTVLIAFLCLALCSCAGSEAAETNTQTVEETTAQVTAAPTTAMQTTAVPATAAAEPDAQETSASVEETTGVTTAETEAPSVPSRLDLTLCTLPEAAISWELSAQNPLEAEAVYDAAYMLEHFNELKTKEGFIVCTVGIQPPEGAVKAQHLNGREDPWFEVKEDGLIHTGHRFEKKDGKIVTYMNEVLNLVWYDANDKAFNQEPEKTKLTFLEKKEKEIRDAMGDTLQDSRFQANTMLLPAECFLSVTAANGDRKLTYELSDSYISEHREELINSQEGFIILETKYRAPEGAVEAVITRENGEKEHFTVEADGYIRIGSRIEMQDKQLRAGGNYLDFKWMDADGKEFAEDSIVISIDSGEPVITNYDNLPAECFSKPTTVETLGNTTFVTYYLNKDYLTQNFESFRKGSGIPLRTYFKAPEGADYMDVKTDIINVMGGNVEELIIGEYGGINHAKYALTRFNKWLRDDKKTSAGITRNVVIAYCEEVEVIHPEKDRLVIDPQDEEKYYPAGFFISRTYDETTGIIDVTVDAEIAKANPVGLEYSVCYYFPEDWEYVTTDAAFCAYPPYIPDFVAGGVELKKSGWYGYEEVAEGKSASEPMTFTFKKPDGSYVDVQFTIVMHGKK